MFTPLPQMVQKPSLKRNHCLAPGADCQSTYVHGRAERDSEGLRSNIAVNLYFDVSWKELHLVAPATKFVHVPVNSCTSRSACHAIQHGLDPDCGQRANQGVRRSAQSLTGHQCLSTQP